MWFYTNSWILSNFVRWWWNYSHGKLRLCMYCYSHLSWKVLVRHAGVPIRPLNNKQDQRETRNLHFLKGLEILIWNLMNTNTTWTFISLQEKYLLQSEKNWIKKRNPHHHFFVLLLPKTNMIMMIQQEYYTIKALQYLS